MSKEGDGEKNSRPKRKLSRFLARKMLYDLITNNLDEERRKAVQEFVAEDWDTHRELEQIQEGLNYSDELSQTKISEPLMLELSEYRSFWGRWSGNRFWRNLPDSLKWGVEALGLSSIAVLVVLFLPWNKLTNLLPKPPKDLVLVEMDRETEPKENQKDQRALMSDQGEGRASSTLTQNYPRPTHENSTKSLASVEVSVQEGGSEEKSLLPQQNNEDSNSISKSIQVAESKPEPKPVEDEEIDDLGASEANNLDGSPNRALKSLEGFVYRAFMNLDSLDKKSPKIVERIKSLGGVKAGQVELGWRKPKGSYFHFSVPEYQYDELLKSLRNFGPVRIYKDPHWRVMPQGKIRFILWIEDNGVK